MSEHVWLTQVPYNKDLYPNLRFCLDDEDLESQSHAFTQGRVIVRWLADLPALEKSAKALRQNCSEEEYTAFFGWSDWNDTSLQETYPQVPDANLLLLFWQDAVDEWALSETPPDYEDYGGMLGTALSFPDTVGELVEMLSLLPPTTKIVDCDQSITARLYVRRTRRHVQLSVWENDSTPGEHDGGTADLREMMRESPAIAAGE